MKIKVDILVFLEVLDSFKHRGRAICRNLWFAQENAAAENTRWHKLSGFYGSLLLPYFDCMKNIVSILTWILKWWYEH